MAIEILECDPTVWSDQSFFNVDQNQHCCDITSKLSSGEQEWGLDDMKQFWDSFEVNFNNEPDFQLEVMSDEVDSQRYKTKTDDELDPNCLTASAFLSPVSMAPSSPAEQIDNNFDHQLELSSDMTYMTGVTDQTVDEDLDNTSAMDILDKILSAHSSDNEDSQEECFDFAINNAVEYFTEVADESNITDPIPQVVSNPLIIDSNESMAAKGKDKPNVKHQKWTQSLAEINVAKDL
jgi:hypothetical protein